MQTVPAPHSYPPLQHGAGSAQMHIVNDGDVSLIGEHTPPSPHVGLHVGYVPLQVIGKHPD